MRALILNCSLKASPERSNTEALSYLETDHKHDWSEKTGRTAASNLAAVARALQANPIPAPPG